MCHFEYLSAQLPPVFSPTSGRKHNLLMHLVGVRQAIKVANFVARRERRRALNAIYFQLSLAYPWCPAGSRYRPSVGFLLAQRHRRWPNISPTLIDCLVFAGLFVDLSPASLARSEESWYFWLIRKSGWQEWWCVVYKEVKRIPKIFSTYHAICDVGLLYGKAIYPQPSEHV